MKIFCHTVAIVVSIAKYGIPILLAILSWYSVIQGWATIKINTRINVFCTRLVPHSTTN